MKYILITKDIITQEPIHEQEFKSIRQMAKSLDSTYCSCYSNFLYHFDPEGTKPSKKHSQVQFNNKYKIVGK